MNSKQNIEALIQYLIQQQKMCFSDSRVNSQAIKNSFKRVVKKRKQYTNHNSSSNFMTCMLEYMEYILQRKVGEYINQQKSFFSSLPCFGDSQNYRNVRKQFQNAYESCNAKEQLDFYCNFVNSMTRDPVEPIFLYSKLPNSSIINPGQSKINQQSHMMLLQENESFNVQIKGTLYWNKKYIMTMIPQRFCIKLKNLNTWEETLINLRNYIMRESKQMKQLAFVLCGIVPIHPQQIRFSVTAQKNISPMNIIGKIKELAQNAMLKNVQQWSSPVNYIKDDRIAVIQKNRQITSVFNNDQVKIDKAVSPSNGDVSKIQNINNPIKTKIKNKVQMKMIQKVEQNRENKDILLNNIFQKMTKQQPQQTPLVQMKKVPESNSIKQSLVEQIAIDEIQLSDVEYKSPLQDSFQKNMNRIDEPFSKKKKTSLSEQDFNQHTEGKRKNFTKKNSQSINYALANNNYDTRSEAAQKNLKSMKKVDEGVDEPESAKSIIKVYQVPQIQEEQFGNASKLYQQSQSARSFYTIPQLN